MKFTDVYSQFLNTLSSDGLAELSDADITAYLDELMIRAIADFSFPYVSLTYTHTDDVVYSEDALYEGYYFDNVVTQREINVLIVMVKSYWLEHNLDDDSLFGLVYFDRDVRTYSAGNKIKAMQSRYELSQEAVKKALNKYYAVEDDLPSIETIYDDE